MFFKPVVTIEKPTWRRIEMLVNELSYMEDGEELQGLDLESATEKYIQNIVDEYARQYFEESTRAAAELVNSRRKARARKLLEY